MYVVLEGERARREQKKKKSSTARNGPRTREKGRESEFTKAGGECPQTWPKEIIMIISVGLEGVVGAKIR